jgi:hypothetical protein
MRFCSDQHPVRKIEIWIERDRLLGGRPRGHILSLNEPDMRKRSVANRNVGIAGAELDDASGLGNSVVETARV